MRDQEADEDEKLFTEMQAAAANLPPRQRREKARKDTFVKVPLWWFEQATKATQTPTSLRLPLVATPSVEGEESGISRPKRLAGQARG